MSTEKPGDTGKLAVERLHAMLPEERSPNHPQSRQRGARARTFVPRPDEITPKSDPVRRHSLPPRDELSSLEATDAILRATGVMSNLETEVGAPARDHHARQAPEADADTVELSEGHAARVRLAAQKPPEEVKVDSHFHVIGGGGSGSGRAGLLLCIAAIVFAVALLGVGLALLAKEVSNSP